MSEAIPYAALVVVEGAGHMPNLEQPTAFNTALENLFGSVRAVAGGRL